jgi:hypothetical protein
MIGFLLWILIILLICFSVFGGYWMMPFYIIICLIMGALLAIYKDDYKGFKRDIKQIINKIRKK